MQVLNLFIVLLMAFSTSTGFAKTIDCRTGLNSLGVPDASALIDETKALCVNVGHDVELADDQMSYRVSLNGGGIDMRWALSYFSITCSNENLTGKYIGARGELTAMAGGQIGIFLGRHGYCYITGENYGLSVGITQDTLIIEKIN